MHLPVKFHIKYAPGHVVYVGDRVAVYVAQYCGQMTRLTGDNIARWRVLTAPRPHMTYNVLVGRQALLNQSINHADGEVGQFGHGSYRERESSLLVAKIRRFNLVDCSVSGHDFLNFYHRNI